MGAIYCGTTPGRQKYHFVILCHAFPYGGEVAVLSQKIELYVRQYFVVPWFEVQGGAFSNSYFFAVE